MIWYENTITHGDLKVEIKGIYKDGVISIMANNFNHFEKVLTMWSYQEINPDDVLNKYRSKILKLEANIPLLIERNKIV